MIPFQIMLQIKKESLSFGMFALLQQLMAELTDLADLSSTSTALLSPLPNKPILAL